MAIFRREPRKRVRRMQVLQGKNIAISANIWLYRMLRTHRPQNAIQLAATDHGKLMTLVAGKRRSLLMAEDDAN